MVLIGHRVLDPASGRGIILGHPVVLSGDGTTPLGALLEDLHYAGFVDPVLALPHHVVALKGFMSGLLMQSHVVGVTRRDSWIEQDEVEVRQQRFMYRRWHVDYRDDLGKEFDWGLRSSERLVQNSSLRIRSSRSRSWAITFVATSHSSRSTITWSSGTFRRLSMRGCRCKNSLAMPCLYLQPLWRFFDHDGDVFGAPGTSVLGEDLSRFGIKGFQPELLEVLLRGIDPARSLAVGVFEQELLQIGENLGWILHSDHPVPSDLVPREAVGDRSQLRHRGQHIVQIQMTYVRLKGFHASKIRTNPGEKKLIEVSDVHSFGDGFVSPFLLRVEVLHVFNVMYLEGLN